MGPSRSAALLFRFRLNKDKVIVSLACHLFRFRLNKNKTALFRININYIIYIIWHDFILYRMIINKNFGMILFYRVWIPYLVAFYLELF